MLQRALVLGLLLALLGPVLVATPAPEDPRGPPPAPVKAHASLEAVPRDLDADTFQINLEWALYASSDAPIDGQADGAPVTFTPAESGPETEAPPEEAPVVPSVPSDPLPVGSIVALAQASLASLGAAAQTQPQAPIPAPQGPTLPAQTLAAVPIVPPTWLAAVAWSVFLASLGILWPRVLGPAAVGLYARLSRSDVERHPRRALILGAVRGNPGAYIVHLERLTGIRGGVLRHHLDQLAAHGVLRRVPFGRTTRWYEVGTRVAPADIVPPGARRVLTAVDHDPDLTTSAIAERLGITVQATWKHLRSLVAAGAVDPTSLGRARTWRATTISPRALAARAG